VLLLLLINYKITVGYVIMQQHLVSQ